MTPFSKIINSELGRSIASNLSEMLQGLDVGAPLTWDPASQLSTHLQFFVTRLLQAHHREWKSESLDAIFCSRACKTGDMAVRLVGTCVLITDQTVAPFMLDMELGFQSKIVASFDLLLGEPGGGKLGISGPPCNSSKAGLLLLNLPYRLEEVCWTYVMLSNGHES